MNWREHIEAQIADLRSYHERLDGRHETKSAHAKADTMQALLDVAVAANELCGYAYGTFKELEDLKRALDKLREVSDE